MLLDSCPLAIPDLVHAFAYHVEHKTSTQRLWNHDVKRPESSDSIFPVGFLKKKRRFNDPVIGEPNIWNLRRRISRTIKSFCDGRYAHTQGREIDSGNAMILSPSFLAAPPCASTHAAPLPNFGFFPSNRNKIVTSCNDSCWWGSCWWDSCW